MGVRKSCYTCKNYENHGLCQYASKCIDGSEWEISDVYREAETVPVVTEQNETEHDAVNHPEHYTQGSIECIDALKAATTGLQGIEAVCTANAIKYLWRWKHKNGIQDIDKAIWYLNRLKQELSGDSM